MQAMKRNAASCPFHVFDCHIWNHSPPTMRNPPNHNSSPHGRPRETIRLRDYAGLVLPRQLR